MTIIQVMAWFSILIMQLAAPASAPATLPPADHAGVYLITLGPGDAPWEKFGHVMLRIYEPGQNIDVAYNWGMFDFDQKNFIWNFIQGRLWYWMAGLRTEPVLESYLADDRTIWVQELNLSAAQRRDLLILCFDNDQESKRFYKYDYYLDNCSTRVRDRIDEILNGQIKRRATTMPSDLTFRSETSRLMCGDPFLYTGLYFILGQPVDRKLSAWDEMFIPMRMRERFDEISIVDESGHLVPLVRSETLLHASKRAPLRDAPPNWLGWFLLIGTIIGASQAWFAHLARREHTPGALGKPGPGVYSRRAKWGFVAVSLFWSFLAGFAGWFLLYAWFLTDHTAVRDNENILQLSPLLFPLIVLIPLALRGKKRAAEIARWLAGLALALSIAGLMGKVLPMMDQVNGNMIALAIPANAGLFWSVWRMSSLKKGSLA